MKILYELESGLSKTSFIIKYQEVSRFLDEEVIFSTCSGSIGVLNSPQITDNGTKIFLNGNNERMDDENWTCPYKYGAVELGRATSILEAYKLS